MKKEDRTSISVSKDTRDRFMTYLAELIGDRKRVLTQDEVENVLLDCGEAALQKEIAMRGSFIPHEEAAQRKRFVEKHRDEIDE